MSGSKRANSLQCVLDRNAPRPNAFEVHDWLFRDVVGTVQLDFDLYSCILKFVSSDTFEYNAENFVDHEFRHRNGQISKVKALPSGFGVRDVRMFNVPPECPNEVISRAIGCYGTVLSITNERWSTAYKYPVNSGVRALRVNLKRHIPTYLNIAGVRAQVQYSGQPLTCGVCHSTDHLRAQCPKRRPVQLPREAPADNGARMVPLLSEVVAGTAIQPRAAEPSPAAAQDPVTEEGTDGRTAEVAQATEVSDEVVSDNVCSDTVVSDTVAPADVSVQPVPATAEGLTAEPADREPVDGDMQAPGLPADAPEDSQKLGKRRNRRRRSKGKEAAGDASASVTKSDTESQPQTQPTCSQAPPPQAPSSHASLSQSDPAVAAAALRRQFLNLENLLSSSRERGAIALKRKSEQVSGQTQQRTRRDSLPKQEAPPPPTQAQPSGEQPAQTSPPMSDPWADDGPEDGGDAMEL